MSTPMRLCYIAGGSAQIQERHRLTAQVPTRINQGQCQSKLFNLQVFARLAFLHHGGQSLVLCV